MKMLELLRERAERERDDGVRELGDGAERRRFESDGAERWAERERAMEQTRQIERRSDGA